MGFSVSFVSIYRLVSHGFTSLCTINDMAVLSLWIPLLFSFVFFFFFLVCLFFILWHFVTPLIPLISRCYLYLRKIMIQAYFCTLVLSLLLLFLIATVPAWSLCYISMIFS